MAGIGNYEAKPFSLKSGNNPEFKMMGSSPLKKAGCAPGDPGCRGNFKVKKKGRIKRAISKASSWIGGEIKNLQSNIAKKKRARKNKKNYKDTKGGSHKTVRYL